MLPPRSLWWSSLDPPVVERPALERHLDVDVAIVGGGFTGLWTARELKRRDPSLRICVLEKAVCGFGASGRNGGWASALFPLSDSSVIRHYGGDAFTHQRQLLRTCVGELGDAAEADGIDAHFKHGGTLTFARSEMQARRLREHVKSAHERGSRESDITWLEERDARARGSLSAMIGATYTPHCARIHPARLVRGLGAVNEALGVQIYENTAVTRIVPRRQRHQAEVVTVGASVHAQFVVRATEGYTPTLPGQRRAVTPLYSLMIATEPLPRSFWEEVGFGNGETFTDGRHLIIYGQRTKDDRLAFGGRGAPYHFGSTVEERFDHDPRVSRLLECTLRELFPSMSADITHRWGGPLAMPRDLTPSVIVDYDSGLASAGGYSGDGVVLSRVASIALADLLTNRDGETEYTRLPFVQRRSRRWELEPLRWLGISAGLSLAARADTTESRRGVESRASGWLDRLTGESN